MNLSSHRRVSVLLGLALGACQRSAPEPRGDGTRVLLAAGDIAGCDSDGDEATAALVERVAGTVVTLGDHVYPAGTLEDYTRCYAPSWGRLKSRTRPVPGNHDYLVAGAAGYYAYFGAAAGDPDKGYYSYEVGPWHVVALNSELVGDAFTEQERWLREDLAAHPVRCTLAYMHRPLFSTMAGRDNSYLRPLWQALYDARADVVLAGHDHFYERSAPRTPGGDPEMERGLRQFVVGTGGRSHYSLEAETPTSEARLGETYGVLKLTLEDDAYTWEFLAVGGGVGDRGRSLCH